MRALLRANASDEEIVAWVNSVVMEKEEGHRHQRTGICAAIANHGVHRGMKRL